MLQTRQRYHRQRQRELMLDLQRAPIEGCRIGNQPILLPHCRYPATHTNQPSPKPGQVLPRPTIGQLHSLDLQIPVKKP